MKTINQDFQTIKAIIKEFKIQKMIKDDDIEIKKNNVCFLLKKDTYFIFDEKENNEKEIQESSLKNVIYKFLTKEKKSIPTAVITRKLSSERASFIAKHIPEMEWFFDEVKQKFYFKNKKGVVLYKTSASLNHVQEILNNRKEALLSDFL